MRLLGVEVFSVIGEAEAQFFDVPDPSFPDLRRLLPAGALVLDAGCGRGRNVEHLEAQGFRSIALDCDAEQLAHVRARRSVDVVQADMFSLPFEDARVNAVVAWQVLCQRTLPQMQLLFDEMHRVLAAEGLLIVADCCSAWASDARSVLPPTFEPVRTEPLDPVVGWPRRRWLCIARKNERARTCP